MDMADTPLLPVTVTKVVVSVLMLRLLHQVVVPEHKLSIGDGDRHEDELVGVGRLGKSLMALVSIGAAGYLALCLAFVPQHAIRQPWTLSDLSAAVLCISGLALRRWSQLHLGRMFTFEVGIRKGHRLVLSGPYRLLRHPSYTGLAIAIAGFAWFVRFHPGHRLWLLQLVVGSAALAKRVQNEESTLAREFGEEWQRHCARTWKLLPFVY